MEQKKKRMFKWLTAAASVLLVAGLLYAACLYVQNIKVSTFVVEGNEHYSDKEFIDLLFPEEKDRLTVNIWLGEKRGEHKEIPFVSRYEVELTDLHTVQIMVYEKNIVACLKYMGSIMYFDKDGIVVESEEENNEGVPEITGIEFSQIVMHQPIAGTNEEIFTVILSLTQLLSLYELDVDKVYYNDDLNARLYMGSLKVELGDRQYMDEKILALKSMLPQLTGQAGTLYLDSYDPHAVNPHYRFKPDSVKGE